MQNQKNLFLAIGLSIAIIVVFQFLFPQQTMMSQQVQQSNEEMQPVTSIDQKKQDNKIVIKSKEEILLTCYICHPSLCNDNLSGVVLLTLLAKYLTKFNSEFSIRFLFIPETIGAITWIHRNQNN